MRSPVVCTATGFAGGGEEGAKAAEPRGVSEVVEASRPLPLGWRAWSVLPASGAEMKSTVN
jgi:hypothetical protein